MALPTGYLLDTNILVALVRGNNLGQHLDAVYDISRRLSDFLMCIVSVGECGSLAIQWGWGATKSATLSRLLAGCRRVDISDPAVLTAYAEIDSWSDAHGRKMGKNDLWIAAVARCLGTTILTTDRDFDHLNPSDPSRTWCVDRVWIDPNAAPTP